MALALTVQVHRLTGDPDDPVFPTADLADLFAPFGVALAFVPGADVGVYGGTPDAPDGEPLSEARYRAIADALAGPAPTVGQPCHVILSRRFEAPGVLGSLFHRMHGVAAVFKDGIASLGVDAGAAMVQTCGHEIGHMLNQGHEYGAGADARAMCQSSLRIPVLAQIPAAWTSTGKPRPAGLQAFPFSAPNESDFAAGGPAVLPWGMPFVGDGVDDSFRTAKPAPLLDLRLASERPAYGVGDCLLLEVSLHNRGPAPLAVPYRLRPEYHDLVVEIRPPDAGEWYRHRPRYACCDSRTRTLAPGGAAYEYVSVVDGPRFSVFPSAGTYGVRASVPSLGLRSDPIDVRVEHDPRLGPDFDPGVSRWLAQGARVWTGTHARQFERMVRTSRARRGPLPAIVAFGLRMKTRVHRLSARPGRVAPLALARLASRGLVHAALREEALRLAARGGARAWKALEALVEKHCGDEVRDASIRERIREIRESAVRRETKR